MLDELLGSRLRAKILGWLLSHPDERYFGRQLAELIKENSANTSRELLRLTKLGILTCQVQGRQKYYQVNKKGSVFSELRGLVLKTSGLAGVLKTALKPLIKKIKAAFIYGSFAANSEKADSDVDVMIIGSCTFGEVVDSLGKAQEKLGREINPSVYPVDEFKKKISTGHHFIKSVIAEPKIFIVGDEDELERLA
jgi:DNA-binding transcriptional ArsR family regulator